MLRKKSATPSHLRRFLLVVLCVIGTIIGLLIFLLLQPLPPGRTTVLVLGDPVELVSYDRDRERFTVIQLTKDAHISGVFGLGEYRLEALWKLGVSEASPSAILRESLAEEFGVPIPRLIGKTSDPFEAWEGDFVHAKDFFRWGNLVSFINGGYESTFDVFTYMKLISLMGGMDPSNTDRFRLRENSGLVPQTDKDLAQYLRFDRAAFDIRTADSFEELAVRQEAKRVVVLNTTQKPAIGSRVGRMIGKLGAFVVSVDNDVQSAVKGCEISGSETELASITSKRIQQVFGCQSRLTDYQAQGDLTVRVGQEYADRYMVAD